MSLLDKPFLADTQWYSMTNRIDNEDFVNLAELRKNQGFDAIQLVVGVPPEIGPKNSNAKNNGGFPWDLEGNINVDYLKYCRERIIMLNELGLEVIVYGAWGQHIDWVGWEGMENWWKAIIEQVDDLNVMYCLTGEINIWVNGESKMLLPDRSTTDIYQPSEVVNFIHRNVPEIGKRIGKKLISVLDSVRDNSVVIGNDTLEERVNDWYKVLEFIDCHSSRPIIVHPGANVDFTDFMPHDLIDALTLQTGHSNEDKDRVWRWVQQMKAKNLSKPIINLEPWYEGIRDQFWVEDQVFAYWTTMLAGASAYCYGAHGVWNIGDGKFMSHWGKAKLEDAMGFQGASTVGKNHAMYKLLQIPGLHSEKIEVSGGNLISMKRFSGNTYVTYYPDIRKARIDHKQGLYIYDPVTNVLLDSVPDRGQLIVTNSTNILQEV